MPRLKKLFIIFPVLCAVVLTACGRNIPKAEYTAQVIILENDFPEYNLHAAEVWEKGSVSLDVRTDRPIYGKEGEEITADALASGMVLEIGYNGDVWKVPPYYTDIVYLKLTGETVDITELAEKHARRNEP